MQGKTTVKLEFDRKFENVVSTFCFVTGYMAPQVINGFLFFSAIISLGLSRFVESRKLANRFGAFGLFCHTLICFLDSLNR